MKNHPHPMSNFEQKKCKCDKECGRCKALKTSKLYQTNQD